MKSHIIVLLLLLATIGLPMVEAANQTTVVCASPSLVYQVSSQVSSLTKIVDDIDRRSDVMESAMATRQMLNATERKILNKTASHEDMQSMKKDFTEFVQSQNWKWTTQKAELFMLILFLGAWLFIMQKFWEAGQEMVYWFLGHSKELTMKWGKEARARDKELKQLRKLHANQAKTIDRQSKKIQRMKKPSFWDKFWNRGKKVKP